MLVPHKHLDTVKPLLNHEIPPPGTIRVKGAGMAGELCNGDYPQEGLRDHRGKRLYRNEHGAIIYWGGFWKMNYYDDVGGWYFAVEGSAAEPLPPEGQWTNYGYSGGRAHPCPFVSKGNLPFPKPTGDLKVRAIYDIQRAI